jgi:hypothetical protein
METLVEKGLDSAPYLLLGLAGMVIITVMFLKHIRTSEEDRRDWNDARHKEFFTTIGAAQDRANECIDHNTKVMGAVLERLRKD